MTHIELENFLTQIELMNSETLDKIKSIKNKKEAVAYDLFVAATKLNKANTLEWIESKEGRLNL